MDSGRGAIRNDPLSGDLPCVLRAGGDRPLPGWHRCRDAELWQGSAGRGGDSALLVALCRWQVEERLCHSVQEVFVQVRAYLFFCLGGMLRKGSSLN